jgi:hypothetical protein
VDKCKFVYRYVMIFFYNGIANIIKYYVANVIKGVEWHSLTKIGSLSF